MQPLRRSTPGRFSSRSSSSRWRSPSTGWLSPSVSRRGGSTRSSTASAGSPRTPRCGWPDTSRRPTGSGSTCRRDTTSRSRRTTSGPLSTSSSRCRGPDQRTHASREMSAFQLTPIGGEETQLIHPGLPMSACSTCRDEHGLILCFSVANGSPLESCGDREPCRGQFVSHAFRRP